MKSKKLFPIKFVASQTGVKPHNIRSWEERYGAVRPERSVTNRRLYSEDDIERLKLLKRAVDQGHNISSVAQLSSDELCAVVRQDHIRPPDTKSSYDSDSSSSLTGPEQDYRALVEQALSHVVRLDSLSLESVLNEAAVVTPRRAFLQEVIVPLFSEIGVLWQSGRMKIINEHMASVIVRATLWDMLRSVELSASAPRIVTATPTGHWHEFGAMAIALVAAEAGWQPFYFGPNLPAEEIAYAVRKVNADALGLSLNHQLNRYKDIQELKKIRRSLEHETPIIVGGNGANHSIASDRTLRATVINDFDELRKNMDTFSMPFQHKGALVTKKNNE